MTCFLQHIFFLLLELFCLTSIAYTACLSHGDESVINNLFSSRGANTIVSLCANAVFNLKNPIIFTDYNQELSTEGYPTDATRAILVVTGVNQTAAIVGNCNECSNLKIRNIQVNGNRPALGRFSGSANIEIGGSTSNQLVDHVHSYEPRGWSCLHIAESGTNRCTNATIINNDIGPSGNSDRQWADGISMACTHSLVANNIITDATDGAIVIFGAPFTTVMNNTIIAMSRVLLGAINMVDYEPYSGDYSGVIVTDNTIWAASAFIKTGIAIGPAVWGADTTNYNRNGIVRNNTIKGNNMGYGIIVSGAQNFTVVDNNSTANYSGSFTSNCFTPNNAPPMAFLKSTRADGIFQSNFIVGRAQYIICIEPGVSNAYTYQPGQLNLYSDQQINLQNGTFLLQNDGNLVLYQAGIIKWTSNSRCSDCSNKQCRLTFDSLGQLVIYKNTTTLASWPPNYNGTLGFSSVRISDMSPYFTFIDGNNSIIWASSYDFYPSFHLNNDNFVRQLTDTNPIYLTLLNDGNLAIYNGSISTGTLLWSTSITGKTCNKGCSLSFQGDGNIVIYGDQGVLWATGTNPSGRKLLFNTTSPYLQIFNSTDAVIWHS
ncbi:unnamed protein product [Adineta steineri]|uniref:Bulb-type lectin domain-containing protein n=1 Tax=Adineta steineri TaxID=433720 RepID=A0A819J1B5_9BILA|nr:unnamed protein product [Adineta steineri]CAF3920385.1 unnamed protein product [Adineta steineri]